MSIRQIIIGGILAGKTTVQITAEVQAAHPASMAAQKPAKHVAWYRATLKKEGRCLAPVPPTMGSAIAARRWEDLQA